MLDSYELARVTYNALQDGALVVDARSEPAWPLAGSQLACDTWEVPESFSRAVIFAAATAADGEALAQRVTSLWPSLAGLVTLAPAAVAATFRASFPWAATLQPASPPLPPTWPSCIARGLFLGSVAHASSVSVLKAMGVRGIVNTMDTDGGCSAHDASALRLMNLPRFAWRDECGFNILNDLPRAATAIEDARRAASSSAGGGGSDGCVLVHCHRGVSRSAAAVTAWVLWHCPQSSDGSNDDGSDGDSCSVARAHAFVQRARGAVDVNEGFLEQLSVFASALRRCGGGGAPPTRDALEAALLARAEWDESPVAAALRKGGEGGGSPPRPPKRLWLPPSPERSGAARRGGVGVDLAAGAANGVGARVVGGMESGSEAGASNGAALIPCLIAAKRLRSCELPQ